MHNKSLLILFNLIFFWSSVLAQQETVLFKSKFLPSKKYLTSIESNSVSTLNFQGTEELLNTLRDNGVKFPVEFKSQSFIETSTVTDKVKQNGSFGAVMTYEKVKTIKFQNGDSIQESSPISGLIMKGFYDDSNRFNVDTLISEKVNEALKKSLINMIETVQDKISFPDYPLKTGDSFTNELPMSIPIAGLKQVDLNIITEYFLKEIKSDIAHFDIQQTVELKIDTGQGDISAEGGGKGSSLFNINESMVTFYSSDLEMNVAIVVNGITIESKSHSKSVQRVKIQEN